NIEVRPREGTRHIANAGMRCQRAAAGLPRGDDTLAAVRGEDANGRFVQRRKTYLRHASGKQSRARAPMAHGGISAPEFGKEKFSINRRQKFFSIREAEQAQNSGRAREGLQAGALIDEQKARQKGYPPG